jgi:hypothetical protein
VRKGGDGGVEQTLESMSSMLFINCCRISWAEGWIPRTQIQT